MKGGNKTKIHELIIGENLFKQWGEPQPTAALLAGLLTYVGIVSSLKTIVHVRQLYDDHLKSKAPAIPQAGYIHISRVSRTFENWRYSHLQCCQ